MKLYDYDRKGGYISARCLKFGFLFTVKQLQKYIITIQFIILFKLIFRWKANPY